MGLDLSGIDHAGQWALRIAEQVGAAEYVNPLAGARLFRAAEFSESGVRLAFIDVPVMKYDTTPFEFVPSLSVLDVLMWNDTRDVVAFIREASSIIPAEDLPDD